MNTQTQCYTSSNTLPPSSKRHQITKTRHNHYEKLDQSPNTNLNKIKMGRSLEKKEGESHYHPVALSKHDQDKEKLPKIDKISKAELEDPYMSEEDLEKENERKICCWSSSIRSSSLQKPEFQNYPYSNAFPSRVVRG